MEGEKSGKGTGRRDPRVWVCGTSLTGTWVLKETGHHDSLLVGFYFLWEYCVLRLKSQKLLGCKGVDPLRSTR